MPTPLTARTAAFPARKTLTRGDRVVLRAVAEAMFSQDGEIEVARLDAHLEEVDACVSAASKTLRFGLRVALFVIRLAPILLFHRLRLFESLALDERVHVLSRLERSPITNLSLAFIGWRTILTLVIYEHPSELRSLGYRDERERYKRALPVVPPVPLESGVRLVDPESERTVASREVA